MKHITTDNQLSASALRNLPSSSPLFLLCPPHHPLLLLMTVAESCPYLDEGREGGREAGGWDRKEEGGGERRRGRKAAPCPAPPPSATTLPVLYRGSCEHNLGIIEMDKLFRLAEMWHCLGLKAKLPPSYFPSTLSVNLR